MRPFLIAFFLICIIPQLGIAQKNAFWECHIKSDSLSKKFAETFYTNRVEAIRYWRANPPGISTIPATK